MASPNSTFTELVSTTFRKHRKEIKDNVSNRNALCKRIMKKGNYTSDDGGLTIATPLDYAENSRNRGPLPGLPARRGGCPAARLRASDD